MANKCKLEFAKGDFWKNINYVYAFYIFLIPSLFQNQTVAIFRDNRKNKKQRYTELNVEKKLKCLRMQIRLIKAGRCFQNPLHWLLFSGHLSKILLMLHADRCLKAIILLVKQCAL